MKNYRCECGNTIYFENAQCLVCGRALGYLPEHGVLSALEPGAPGTDGVVLWRALAPTGADGQRYRQHYRKCANYREERVCNWMIPEADTHAFCASCRLNHIIPNLDEPQNRVLWRRIEEAKRRLLYTLYRLRLPVVGHEDDAEHGLAFEFLADAPSEMEFTDDIERQGRVTTGHRAGVITINLAEADPSARERMRERMNEQYRTLLGHFRHEIGHYYWERLVCDANCLEDFRVLFGDERADYDAALGGYYANGAPADWQINYVSAYAAAHPWEDWAETWAHYLHIVDTLETAHDYEFMLSGRSLGAPVQRSERADDAVFDRLLQDWAALSLALNSLNRSMGMPDAYPFVLSERATEKLRFVHAIIEQGAVS